LQLFTHASALLVFFRCHQIQRATLPEPFPDIAQEFFAVFISDNARACGNPAPGFKPRSDFTD
jgi:hypothetical protein